MASPMFSSSSKKHKKHKSERKERPETFTEKPPGLKLILKVGNQATPEHTTDYYNLNSYSIQDQIIDQNDPCMTMGRSHHKKSKKKKKKKDKSKDRDRKHRHHHKEKKRKREEMDYDEENRDFSGGSPSLHREPRTCVLRQRQERTPVQRMLDQLLGLLEKKDPQQFFAWPVTDNIAPGYSSIITQPMDFSTMRQKIEDNQYDNLQDFNADFKLMCTNAMKYNHVDTIYYKASKKLLHAGSKMMQPEKLGWILNLIPELSNEDMGFEITPELRQNKGGHEDHYDSDHVIEGKKRMPTSKFEAIQDDLTPEEILTKSQIAAREARVKLSLTVARRGAPTMGFLKQRKDGTTNLNILVGGEGVIPGTKKRPVLLGQLCGKLSDGTGQIQGFREDRRNVTKPVKPLYYGAFGSYAPSYDSAFANLSKEESDLVYQTYGSDTAVQYAESVLDFVKDSDYATHLVDSLLDLLTGGDHSKTRRVLDENKKLREEEEAVKTMLEMKPIDAIKVDVEELRSLQDVGIDINFLDNMEEEIKLSEERHELQQKLDSMCQLLQKLQQTQHQRLSQPPPVHLSQCVPPSEEELQVAENITENLTEIAKRVNPGEIVPVGGVRKALGVALPEVEVSAEVGDLESELRQFLESEPALTQSPLRDDKTIEEILME
ncbi:bromodomain-containing protein 7 isoform X1 [Tribolium madens]|uniref:bromodomain-containing protein 7 isoform X1 n=1 Tax=Tribolium madens TaxID=41895 RepID=UPI001CF756CE|nr:bromodomain-containing protein 7 isoform X1 [Tribolium madens]